MLSSVVAKLWTEAPAEQCKLTTQVLPPPAVRTLYMPLSDPSAAPSFASSRSPTDTHSPAPQLARNSFYFVTAIILIKQFGEQIAI